jgi:hypothetical protein
MNRITLFSLPLLASLALANGRVQGDCTQGGHVVVVAGLTATPQFAQQSFVNATGNTPTSGCTVSVFITGSGGSPATLTASTTNATAGVFVADTTGHWYFEAVDGNYDVTLSGAGISTPFTLGNIQLIGYGQSSLANSVPRTFVSKLYDAVSILDFAPGGTSDYTTAMNNAAAAGAGTVLFPCGTYPFSGKVTVPMGVTFAGQGSFGCATLQYTGTSVALVIASAVPGGGVNLSLRRGGLRDIQVLGPGNCTSAPPSGSIGVYMGGDPAGVISPSAYQGEHLYFSNATVQCFDTGLQLGNNAYNSAFFEMSIQNNNRGVYMPTGVTNSGSNMDFHDGIFLSNFIAGVETDTGSQNFNFFGTQFEFNTAGVTGSTVSAFFFGVHFENQADSGCATCGPFISINNSAAFVKIGLSNCTGTYDASTGTLGSMFLLNVNRLTMNVVGFEAYSSTTLTQIFNVTVSQVFLTQIHVDQITGDEANNIQTAFNTGAPLQAIVYEVHPNASIETGQKCFQCSVPDSSGTPLTIGNPSTLATPPPNLVGNASASGVPRRAGAVFGDWYLEQDVSLTGMRDFGLFNNSTAKLYLYFNPATGNVCIGLAGTTGCTNSLFSFKVTSNSSGVGQLAIIDGPSQNGACEIILEQTDGGSQLGICSGSGSPNGVIIGNPGNLYLNRSGGAGTTLYVKESGSGTNTGWIAK